MMPIIDHEKARSFAAGDDDPSNVARCYLDLDRKVRQLSAALRDVLAAIDDGESVGSTDAVRRARELI